MRKSNPPTLFLLIDAIPYELAREVWADGALPGFAEVRPVVSVFPSLTEIALHSFMKESFPARPPGYEARYYHSPSGEIRGPGDLANESVMELLRASPHQLVSKAAVYILRDRLAYAQIRWITHRLRREGVPWLGYLSATDGVAHFSGREALTRSFRDIAASINDARLEYRRVHGVLPGTVLCSDHGVFFGKLSHLSSQHLRRCLEEAGFSCNGGRRSGVVLVPYGDVGAGVVHLNVENVTDVAETVARAPGVDLVFAWKDDGFLVFGGAGEERAHVYIREGSYRYEAERGDPLEYLPVWEGLERKGRLRDGWVSDEDLFSATWDHRYPDALFRIKLALGDLVLYPAKVLFSMQDTYTYGPALTHFGGDLLGGISGNHGSLSASQSLAFAAHSDDGEDPWPGAPALRPAQVFHPWTDLVREGREGAR